MTAAPSSMQDPSSISPASPAAGDTKLSFPEGEYTVYALERSLHGIQKLVEAGNGDPFSCSCCKASLSLLTPSWEPDYDLCHDCFHNQPAARLFWTAEWTSSMTSPAQVCEGCQCSAVGLTMYQPFISRCHKCELINAKMHLLTARRFGVDPEFPWEAFRKTQLADLVSSRQAICKEANRSDHRHCEACLESILDGSLCVQPATAASAGSAELPPLSSNLLRGNLAKASRSTSSPVIMQASSAIASAANMMRHRSLGLTKQFFRAKQPQLVASPCFDLPLQMPQLQHMPPQLQSQLTHISPTSRQATSDHTPFGAQQAQYPQQARQAQHVQQAPHAQQAQHAQHAQQAQHQHSCPELSTHAHQQPSQQLVTWDAATSPQGLSKKLQQITAAQHAQHAPPTPAYTDPSYLQQQSQRQPQVHQTRAMPSVQPRDAGPHQPPHTSYAQLLEAEPSHPTHPTQTHLGNLPTAQDHLRIRRKWGQSALSASVPTHDTSAKPVTAVLSEFNLNETPAASHGQNSHAKEQVYNQDVVMHLDEQQQQQQHFNPLAAPVRT